ncbi:MAG: ABC transporter permease [Vicinamibacteria bacterium]
MSASPFADIAQDIRYAARQLRKDRSFTTIAVLTLALGIGATTTLFTVLNAVVLTPLPFPHSDRLLSIATTWRGDPGAVSVGNFFLAKERSRTIEAIAARSRATFNLTEGGDPERISGARVTAGYFALFGANAELGRTFTSDEDVPGSQLAVLSHRLFTRRFGANAAVIGQTIQLSGRPHTVIGVMPRSFQIPEDKTEVWTPLALTKGPDSFDASFLSVTARLKEGVSQAQIEDDARAISRAMVEEAPRDNEGRRLSAAFLIDEIVGDYRQRLFLLLGAVSLVFLIACVNVASLLMARGASRTREISVRAALGASRLRIARQLLTEAFVLCSAGALAGLALAAVALPVLISQAPADVPRLADARINGVALITATSVAFLATLIAGLVPALRESRAGLTTGVAQASRGSVGAVRDRVRQTFVAVEVALALMLLMSAGLLVRSGQNLDRVSPGFDPGNLLSARFALPGGAYPGEERPAVAIARMVANLKSSAGVADAAASTRPPLIGDVDYGLRVEGREVTPQNRINSRMQMVTPGYIETMRIPLKLGRTFTLDDRRGGTRVMIVSETLAQTAWPGESPIGKRMACCEGGPDQPVWKEIVGVVADTRARGMSSGSLNEFYLPIDQAPSRSFDANDRSVTLVARAVNGRPESLTSAIRQAVRTEDASVPLFDIATMSSRVAESTAVTRFNRLLLLCLGGVGLALAAIGIYGVIAYLVSQRTREISVRMALGALPSDVVRLVVGQGVRAVGLGVVLGGLGVIAQGRAIEALLFGISGRDPMTFATVAGVLLLFALCASALPAFRASRIEPTKALADS